eukprot:symbB.v1.2.010010.t1/scaffold645.1/size176818/9
MYAIYLCSSLRRFIYNRDLTETDFNFLLTACKRFNEAFIGVVQKDLSCQTFTLSDVNEPQLSVVPCDHISSHAKGAYATLQGGFWYVRDRLKTIDLETGVDKCLQVVEEDRCKIIENLVPAVKPFDTTVLPDLKAPDPFDTAIGILEDRAEAEITDVARLQTQEALPWLTVAERASAFFDWLRGKGEECEDLAKLLGSCAFETVEPEQSSSLVCWPVVSHTSTLLSKHQQKERKPFNLCSNHELHRSKKRLRSAVTSLAAIAGVDDGRDVADKLFPVNKQGGLPLENLDDPQAIADGDVQGQGADNAEDAGAEHAADEGQRSRRCPGDSRLLSELVKIVEESLQLPPGAAKEKVMMSRYPTTLRSKVLSKWTAKYFKFRLWSMDVSVSSRLRSIPNWWLDEIGAKDLPRKGKTTIAGVPREVAKMVDAVQAEKCIGITDATKRADASQGPRMLKRTIQKAVDAYNKQAIELKEKVEASNAQAWEDFKSAVLQDGEGEDDEEVSERKKGPTKRKLAKEVKQLKERIKPIPKTYENYKPNHMTFARFNRAFRNFTRSVNTAGNYLSYDDPRMEHARCLVRKLLEENGIPYGLCLNLGVGGCPTAIADRSGILNKQEFVAALTSMELGLTRREINAIMFQVDQDRDGNVSYREFVPFAFDLLQKMASLRLLETELENDELAQYILDLFKAKDTFHTCAMWYFKLLGWSICFPLLSEQSWNNATTVLFSNCKDTEMTGMLGLDEMRDLLHQAMLGLTRMQIYTVLSEAEVNADNMISYASFCPRAVGLIRSMLSFEKAIVKNDTSAQDEEKFYTVLDEAFSGSASMSLADLMSRLEGCSLLDGKELEACARMLGTTYPAEELPVEEAKSQIWALVKSLRRAKAA